MKFYQIVYFTTILFACIVSGALNHFFKIDFFQALSFSVTLYVLYHILEWKYNYEEGEE